MESADFFNKNAEAYVCNNIYEHDILFLDFIIRHSLEQPVKVADIGGGSGLFMKALRQRDQYLNLTVIDPTVNLLKNITDPTIDKKIGWLPDNLPDEKYDIIHIKEVLHHITSATVADSKSKIMESLVELKRALNPNGYLLLHELYYESFARPTLSRDAIFLALDVQLKTKLKIPFDPFLEGLSVCFLTRSEMRSLITMAGFKIEQEVDYEWNRCLSKRVLFLKNWGRMCFICTPI